MVRENKKKRKKKKKLSPLNNDSMMRKEKCRCQEDFHRTILGNWKHFYKNLRSLQKLFIISETIKRDNEVRGITSFWN